MLPPSASISISTTKAVSALLYVDALWGLLAFLFFHMSQAARTLQTSSTPSDCPLIGRAQCPTLSRALSCCWNWNRQIPRGGRGKQMWISPRLSLWGFGFSPSYSSFRPFRCPPAPGARAPHALPGTRGQLRRAQQGAQGARRPQAAAFASTHLQNRCQGPRAP